MVDRVYKSGTAATAPAPPATPATGYPTEGDALAGTAATVPGAYWFHMITESLRNVVVAAGLEPNHADLDQLAQAIATVVNTPASDADMKAASNLMRAVTPGRQHLHPLMPKKVIRFAGRTTDGACVMSVNLGGVARVERKGTGYYRVLFSTTGSGDNMPSGAYVALGFAQRAASAPASVGGWGDSISATSPWIAVLSVTAQDASGLVLKVEGNGQGSAVDPDYIELVIFGEAA